MVTLDDETTRPVSVMTEAMLVASSELAADHALIRRVIEQDAEAQEQLAERLVARVRHAAHELMPVSADAEDAAQHALIELLRNARAFRAPESIESWADRVMSGSIIRYARAVQRRSGGTEPNLLELESRVKPRARVRSVQRSERRPRESTSTRLLHAAFGALPASAREPLLLRHTFGRSVRSISSLCQVSEETVRDRIIAARRELRRAVVPGVFASASASVGGTSGLQAQLERWEVLCDREALGDGLTEQEQADLRALNQALAAEIGPAAQIGEELSVLLTRDSEHAPQKLEQELVVRALSAVQVLAPGRRVRAIDHDAELARDADPEGPSWVPFLATSLSAIMTLGAGLALVYYEPRSVRRAASVEESENAGVQATSLVPQVEALFQARASERGPRLWREGKPVAQNGFFSQGDEISAGERAGCFVIDGRLEFCLAPSSTVKLEDLSTGELKLSLWRGRVTSHLARGAKPIAFRVEAGDVRVSSEQAATLGVERNDDASTVRVRLLRGVASVQTASTVQELSEPKVVVFRGQEGTLETTELLGGIAQREWDIVGVGRFGAAAVPNFAANEAARELALSARMQAQKVGPLNSEASAFANRAPRELIQEAWELVKAERWTEAAKIYEFITRERPESDEAHIVKVRLGGLLLERLGDPQRALFAFEGYLREGGGALEAEARYGRVAVFRRVGQREYELRAIEDFLQAHPESSHVPALEARLRVLAAAASVAPAHAPDVAQAAGADAAQAF